MAEEQNPSVPQMPPTKSPFGLRTIKICRVEFQTYFHLAEVQLARKKELKFDKTPTSGFLLAECSPLEIWKSNIPVGQQFPKKTDKNLINTTVLPGLLPTVPAEAPSPAGIPGS